MPGPVCSGLGFKETAANGASHSFGAWNFEGWERRADSWRIKGIIEVEHEGWLWLLAGFWIVGQNFNYVFDWPTAPSLGPAGRRLHAAWHVCWWVALAAAGWVWWMVSGAGNWELGTRVWDLGSGVWSICYLLDICVFAFSATDAADMQPDSTHTCREQSKSCWRSI